MMDVGLVWSHGEAGRGLACTGFCAAATGARRWRSSGVSRARGDGGNFGPQRSILEWGPPTAAVCSPAGGERGAHDGASGGRAEPSPTSRDSRGGAAAGQVAARG